MDTITSSILFFVLGIIAITYGLFYSNRRTRLLKNGIKVDGVLIRITVTGGDSVELEIGFKTKHGQQKYIKHWAIAPCSYSLGNTLPVIYDKNNPANCMVDEGPYKPNGTDAIYIGAVFLMIAFINLMTQLRGDT